MGSHLGMGSLTPDVCLSIFIHHTWTWNCPFHVSAPFRSSPPFCTFPSYLHPSIPPPLCPSTPPSCLDECVFFKSLVAGLPYSLIFLTLLGDICFIVYLYFLLYLCKEVRCIYLYLHLDQMSQIIIYIFIYKDK